MLYQLSYVRVGAKFSPDWAEKASFAPAMLPALSTHAATRRPRRARRHRRGLHPPPRRPAPVAALPTWLDARRRLPPGAIEGEEPLPRGDRDCGGGEAGALRRGHPHP